jgi:hypothetical protein
MGNSHKRQRKNASGNEHYKTPLTGIVLFANASTVEVHHVHPTSYDITINPIPFHVKLSAFSFCLATFTDPALLAVLL